MTSRTATTYGAYVFPNYGPLTTTFTQPAACVTGSSFVQIAESTFTEGLVRAEKCVPDANIRHNLECYPNQPSTVDDPVSGVGVAVQGDQGPISESGAFEPDTELLEEGFIANWGPIAFEQILQPGETAVLCCPSAFTPLDSGLCYSRIPDYPVSTACEMPVPEASYDRAVTSVTVGGSTYTITYPSMSPSVTLDSSTTTFDAEMATSLEGYSVVPMVTLAYQAIDISPSGSDDDDDDDSQDDSQDSSDNGGGDGGGNAGSKVIPGLGSSLSMGMAVALIFGIYLL